MEIFTFDRGEMAIYRFGSENALATRIASGVGEVQLSCLRIGAGGTLGAHAAPGEQIFLVVAGEGWVSGPDGVPVRVSAGTAVRWDAREVHASGSASGMTAIAAEGAALEIYAPLRGPGPGT